MKKIKEIVKNKKGIATLESLIAMTGILMITFFGISYYTYLVPRQMLTLQVHTLATTAKLQGGLTDGNNSEGDNDIAQFQERLKQMGYDSSKVTVQQYYTDQATGVNYTLAGVEPLDQTVQGTTHNYLSRTSKDVITIDVSIPTKSNFLDVMSKWFGANDSSLGTYHFTEAVMSERY